MTQIVKIEFTIVRINECGRVRNFHTTFTIVSSRLTLKGHNKFHKNQIRMGNYLIRCWDCSTARRRNKANSEQGEAL